MLLALIAKDLRRVWRNPLPWMLNLALPIAITAVIGMVFGGQATDDKLGRIRVGVVDEDKSALTDMLRSGLGQGKAAEHLEAIFLDRTEGEKQLRDDKLSAVVIIPTNFTSGYLNGSNVEIELIKNPAEQIYPTVIHELLSVVASGLNVISRNLSAEFPKWREVVNDGTDYHGIANIVEETGDKLQGIRKYVFPALITYTNGVVVTNTSRDDAAATNSTAAKTGGAPSEREKAAATTTGEPEQKFNLFAYLLMGMAGLFLLILANQGMNDLHKELFKRTFERYTTLHNNLVPFVLAKAIFAAVIVFIGALIILGGGQLLFHFRWTHPLPLTGLVLAYVVCAAGMMSVTVSLMPDERRANALNNVLCMVLGMAGGCMFPPDNLPAAMREHVMPLLPTYWFATAGRELWWSANDWKIAAAKLAGLGIICVVVASLIFRRKFGKGIR